jgi:predicted ATPase
VRWPTGWRTRHDRGRVIGEPFIRTVRLEHDSATGGYPWDLPALSALRAGLDLHPKVTYLIGENGSGKSTLVELIARAAGMQAEGGSSNFAFPVDDERAKAYAFSSRSTLDDAAGAVRLIRGARQPRTDFFLRAESLFAAAVYLDELAKEAGPLGGDALAAYGGRSLHAQSHGESFLSLLIHRFGPDGLYLLDEPEAALSTQNCLTCLRRIHELVSQGSQFVIATHSPILLAYPEATIYRCHDEGIEAVDFADAEPVRLTQSFLQARERFLAELLDD